MTQKQESNKQSIFERAFLPNGWPDREKVAVAAIRITAGLAVLAVFVALATIICDCGITTWHWIQLLVVPATIAGFSIWFNWAQKKREKEREVRDATIKALQANKESIAYVAYLAKDPRQGDIFEDADFRAKFWPALCLAAVFETSDRTRAVIRDALKSAVKNPNDSSLIQQTLTDMKQAFDDLHEDSQGYKQIEDQKDKGPIDNFTNFTRRRRQLEALIDTLGLENYAQQKVSEVPKE
jgi:hypothetical protein